MPILSVFAPLLKSRFFGFYVNGVTLADGKKFSPLGGDPCRWDGKMPSPGGRCRRRQAVTDEGNNCTQCGKNDF